MSESKVRDVEQQLKEEDLPLGEYARTHLEEYIEILKIFGKFYEDEETGLRYRESEEAELTRLRKENERLRKEIAGLEIRIGVLDSMAEALRLSPD